MNIKTLLIDNYDSYTNNLITLWCESIKSLLSENPNLSNSETNQLNDSYLKENMILIRNNQYTWEFVRDNILPYIDNIIISPGPGNPENSKDFGICKQLIQYSKKPILGVCLGHQGIASFYGSKIIRAQIPVHGQKSCLEIIKPSSKIPSINTFLFDKIPQQARVVRYHSLVIDPKTLSSEFNVIAWSSGAVETLDINQNQISVSNREIMAIQHVSEPLYGVQFHPESIETEFGVQLLSNFMKITCEYNQKPKLANNLSDYSLLFSNNIHHQRKSIFGIDKLKTNSGFFNYVSQTIQPEFVILEKEIKLEPLLNSYKNSNLPDGQNLQFDAVTELLFESLYKDDPIPFLIDGAKENVDGPNMSIMGSLTSPGSVTVRFNADSREITGIEYQSNNKESIHKVVFHQDLKKLLQDSKLEKKKISFFEWVQENLVEPLCNNSTLKTLEKGSGTNLDLNSKKPMFRGGWVGYFSYEMHSESDILIQPFEEKKEQNKLPNDYLSQTPDSNLSLATQSVVLYSPNKNNTSIFIYAICIDKKDQKQSDTCFMSVEDGTEWIDSVSKRIGMLFSNQSKGKYVDVEKERLDKEMVEFVDNEKRFQVIPKIDEGKYKEKIRDAQNEIRNGESYQLCLTNSFEFRFGNSKSRTNFGSKKFLTDLYFKYLRKTNPAPMCCFFYYPDLLRNDCDSIELGILSCSPERFLQIRYEKEEWIAQMKPIKGTAKKIPHGTQICKSCDKTKSRHGYEQSINKKCLECSCESCCKAIREFNQKQKSELIANIKEHAENLMIVDLVRHDLAAISANSLSGEMNPSVRKLIKLESYQTVYQLVSTIEATINTQASKNIPQVMNAFGHCFPPGSMTGAPKKRSVEILSHSIENVDSEESAKRGIYSGSIGYISAYKGQMDWSVVIRTIVATKNHSEIDNNHLQPKFSIGAGGAITILSNPESEWDEVITKLDSVLKG
ncbi:hypothetical protein BB558_006899 [Smittium angustum]|uniref:aminodeoxychorismate synthase n=1 Tax=Smittium angustum TaxID=133377 RepID=A0A2U1IWG0_SMIAN|nr:hypothetical protein BB558_006899 [Smittium angustum]